MVTIQPWARPWLAAVHVCVLAACGSEADGGNSPTPGVDQFAQPQQQQPVQPPVQQPPVQPPPMQQPPMQPPPMQPPPMQPPPMQPPMAGGDPSMMPVEDPMEDPMQDPMEDPTEDPMEDPTEDPAAMGDGECCSDGNCLCHGPDPGGLTSSSGPYDVDSYSVRAGCIYYPTDAEPPFAAVAVSDGYLGSGGCGSFQTGRWGPLLASWGIATMIINTGSSDQPNVRGRKLNGGIDAFKAENESSSSPLYQKLAGRYGTSGFSMGGGGTTYASASDPELLSSVAIMPWGPTRESVSVPTLVICGSSDSTAPCRSHGTPFYQRTPNSTPKMQITVRSGHAGQPSSGGGESGKAGLAFHKVFLEGDERWRPYLVGNSTIDDSNIQ